MKRRRMGTGSIGQLPSTSWRAIVTCKGVKTSACFATRAEAEAWLASMPRPPECCPRCGQTLPVVERREVAA